MNDAGYIRGAGPSVSPRRVGQWAVACGALALAALTIVLAVQGFNENSRLARLQHHGVTVQVTVTSCLGLASGTGITESGYRRRGTFTVGGHSYNEVIGGTSNLYAIGQPVLGVTDPRAPANLSTVQAVSTKHPTWTSYIGAVVALLVLISLLALLAYLSRKRSALDEAAVVVGGRR
jgi:hypothetical protein